MTEPTGPWTIGRLLTWTTNFLKQHGSESPRLDAEVLLAHARGCDRIHLYACFDEIAADDLRDQFRALVRERAAGKPVAYLVGYREFYSREFEVTSDVLIPRPETEYLVVAMLDHIKAKSSTDASLAIADIGTGSGILAVCAALELPNAVLTALDVSHSALEIAARNATRHHVNDRITFTSSDLFGNIDPSIQFDYVLSNPPYIGENERSTLPRDVRDFEPPVALFAGTHGMDIVHRLVCEVPAYLKEGGTLICEFSPPQQAEIRQLVKNEPQLGEPHFVNDLAQQPRILVVTRQKAS